MILSLYFVIGRRQQGQAILLQADNRADEFNRTAMRLHLIVNTLEGTFYS